MLIKESSLVKKSTILDQLNEAIYLNEFETMIQPITIPVHEMSRLGEGATMVRFSDVESLAENNGISYMDAVAAIAEASEVDASKMTIAVDEADLIADPKMVQEMGSYVVIPVSENDIVYQACSEAVNTYIENEDESLLETLVNEGIGDLVKKIREKKEAAKQAGVPSPAPKLLPTNTPAKTPVTEGKVGKVGLGLAALGALGMGKAAHNQHKLNKGYDAWLKDKGFDDPEPRVGKDSFEDFGEKMNAQHKHGVASMDNDLAFAGSLKTASLGLGMYAGDKLYNHFKNKPKNVIAKGIASLRKLMARLKNKLAGNSILPKQKNMLQKAVNKIGETIDKLLAKLQSGANKLSGSSAKLSIKVG